MPKKEKERGKGSFVRMCAGCGRRCHKGFLVRIVRGEDRVFVDLSGREPGRGAYVCRDEKCVAVLKKNGRLSRLLKAPVPEICYEDLFRATKSGDSDGK